MTCFTSQGAGRRAISAQPPRRLRIEINWPVVFIAVVCIATGALYWAFLAGVWDAAHHG